MVRALRLLLILSVGSAVPATLYAQFAITIMQNGQAAAVSNGATIPFNAPLVGQSIATSFTVTYLGVGNAVFPASSNTLSPSSFSGSVSAITLSELQAASFTLTYKPPDAVQEVSQFFWAYNLVATSGPNAGQVTGSGILSFTLTGNAPNVIVGQTSVNNNFQAIPSGGTVQFVDTAVTSASNVTLSISNSGSGPAVINSIAATGSGFQLQGVPFLPVTLAAGTQLSISIQFLPVSTGPQTGTLQIAFNSGTYSASLSGRGISSFLSYQLIQGSIAATLSPNQTITFPSTNVGAKSTIVIQFQNTASTAAVLNSIGVSGTGFAFTDSPFLPATLQPQQISTVTLTFSPVQPGQILGRLFIGNDNFFLSGLASGPLLQFSYVTGGSTLPVVAGGIVSFPPIAVGQTETVQFTSTNTGTAVASEVSIGVLGNGGAFQVSNLPPLPAQLAPNGVSTFTISFSPQTTGQSSTSLLIDNQVFTLSGFASLPPPLPAYHFTGVTGAQQPFQQPAVGISLDAPYPITLTGTLTLTVASSSFSTDPAVQFSSGGRQVAFTIAANALQAVFPNGATQIRLQTGTVAGSITIKPNFTVGSVSGTDITPANPVLLQLQVASASPTLLTAALSARTTTSFTVTVTGYSTTRYLDHLTIQITPAAGSSLSPVPTNIDINAAARLWFQSTASQALGGEFTLDLPFTLGNGGTVAAGTDLTKAISSIGITSANDVGVSNSVKVALP